MSPTLRRHDLVRVTRAGWARLRAMHPARDALLAHWSAHDLPLVVARRRTSAHDGFVSVGLPAPLADDRARVALDLARDEIATVDAFPRIGAVATVPDALRDALRDRRVRVYGAHGWQAISGETYVHARSDIDLLVDVRDESDADAVIARLASLTAWPLDGELAFENGGEVAWREWVAWRAGRVAQIMVKRIDGVSLATRSFA